MNREALIKHLRQVHSIADGTTYDPSVHMDVPGLCFAPLEELDDDNPQGQHLRPEHDYGAY